MSISFSGLASGLDTSSWVDSLVALKKAKVTSLEEEKTDAILTKDTLASIKSFFTSFRSLLEKVTDTKFGIANMDLFAQNLANSSNIDILTATATTEAQEATYKISVDKLASNTEAFSNFVTSYEQKTLAGMDSKLTSLGVTIDAATGKNIKVVVDGVQKGIHLTQNDTIATFIDKLHGAGVNASYNTETGVFSIDIDANDIIDDDDDEGDPLHERTSIKEAFHLNGVNEGYESGSLCTTRTDTVYVAATGSDTIYSIAVAKTETRDGEEIHGGDSLKALLEGGNVIVTLRANGTESTVTIDQNTTMSGFVSALNALNIDAELDATGVFTLSDAEIVNTDGEGHVGGAGQALLDAFGLSVDIYSKSQASSALSHSQVTIDIAKRDTLLSSIGITFTENNTVTIVNSDSETTTVTATEDWTIGSLLQSFTEAGLYAAMNTDGTLEIAGGKVSGRIINELGLQEEPYTAMVTGNPLVETVVVQRTVDLETRLVNDLRVTKGYLEVTKPDGTKYYEKIYSGQTIADFMADMGNLGINTSLGDDGVLTITGGAFATLSDEDVEDLVARGAIIEPDEDYQKGTNLLECLYGSDEIEPNQISVSSTRAKSMALTRSVVTTVQAELTSMLTSLGLEEVDGEVGTAEFTVRDEVRTINLSTTDDIDSLIDKLADAGISASFDEDTHRLTINNATLTGGTSNLADVLDLTTSIAGKYKTSDQLYAQTTVGIDATEDSLLGLYGISNSMSESERTVNLYDSDGTLLGSYTVGEGTTIGDLLDFINDHEGVSASIRDGIITVNNGYIENAALETAMGLETSNKSSYVLGSIMTTTSMAAVSGGTTLGEIISSLGTTDAVSGGYTLRFNSQNIEVNSSTTINQLIDRIYAAGGTAVLDTTGRLSINGGTLDGTVATALGVTSTTHTLSVSADGEYLHTKTVNYADRDTKLADLGINSSSYIIHDNLGNALSTVNVTGTDTLGSVLDNLRTNGINGLVSDGVIGLESAEGKYITGDLATSLGISYSTVTEVVNTTSSSTLAITHTGTVTATVNTTLGEINAITGVGQVINIIDANQNQIGTITNLTTSSTIGDLFEELESWGIQGTITDGVINLFSPEGRYITGDIATNLNIGFENGIGRTMTVAQTITSTAQIQLTDTVKATEADKISDFITLPENKNIIVKDADNNALATIAVNNTTTFGSLFASLSEYGIDGDIHDGVIALTSSNGAYATGDVLTTMSITTTPTVVTTGISSTSSAAITYTQTVNANESDVIQNFVTDAITGTNGSIIVHSTDGAAIGTVNITSTTTFDELFEALSAYGIDGDIHNGTVILTSVDSNYITGEVPTALGIDVGSSTVTVTHGMSATSSAAVQITSTVTATETNKISDFITLPEDKNIVVSDADNNALATIAVDNTTTFGNLFASLSEYGIDGDIHDGRIILTSTNGSYVTGNVIDTLGMTPGTTTVTTTVGMSSSSTTAVSYTETVRARETDAIQDFVTDAITSTNGSIIVHSTDGGAIGTVNITNTTTFDELFEALSAYGIDGDIHNGVIVLTSPDSNYITGEIPTALGIDVGSSTINITTGASVTSTAQVTYTSYITEDDKISDVIELPENKNITIYRTDGSFQIANVNENTTFRDLFTALSFFGGIECRITQGIITLDATNGSYVLGDVIDALGIVTNTTTVTTTVGQTVSTASALTYSATIVATEDSKISDFVAIPVGPVGGNITIYEANGSQHTVSVTSTTTFGELFGILGQYGIDGDIHDGHVVLTSGSHAYATGTVLTNMGIGTNSVSQGSSTVGITITSTAPVTYTDSGTALATGTTAINDCFVGGLGEYNKIIVNNINTLEQFTISISATTTFDDLSASLAEYDITSHMEGGRFVIDYIDTNYDIDTDMGTAMLLNLVTNTQQVTITVGATATSTAAVTYNVESPATGSTTLGELNIPIAATSGDFVYEINQLTRAEGEALGYTCVSTKEELKSALNSLNSSSTTTKILLMNDITLDYMDTYSDGAGGFTRNYYITTLYGELNGNGYTINTDMMLANYVKGTVQNVKIVQTRDDNYLYGVLSRHANDGAIIYNVTTEAMGNVSAGLVGNAANATIDGVSTSGTIDRFYTITANNQSYAYTSEAGGVVARLGENGAIRNCKSDAEIDLTIDPDSPCRAGGVVGNCSDSGNSIENCEFSGELSLDNTGVINYTSYAGIVVGRKYNVSASDCYNNGAVMTNSGWNISQSIAGTTGTMNAPGLTILDANGTQIGTVNVSSNTTIDGLLNELSTNYDISGYISNGQLYLSSADGKTLSGEIAEALGITTTTTSGTNITIGAVNTSSATVTYSVNYPASISSAAPITYDTTVMVNGTTVLGEVCDMRIADSSGNFVFEVNRLTAAQAAAQGYYTVTSGSDFYSVITNDNDAKIILMNDIDVTSDWLSQQYFVGEINGNGYTVTTNCLMFEELDGARIENICFDYNNSSISATSASAHDCRGLIVNSATDSYFNNITVKNVGNFSDIGFGYQDFGMFAGYMYDCALTGISVSGIMDPYGQINNMGGIAGTMHNGTISDSICNVEIDSVNGDQSGYVGGFVGNMVDTANITRSTFSGRIRESGTGTNIRIGAIAGTCDDSITDVNFDVSRLQVSYMTTVCDTTRGCTTGTTYGFVSNYNNNSTDFNIGKLFVEDHNGNRTALAIPSTDTFNDLISILEDNGFEAELFDGFLTVTSAEGKILTGYIADALGLTSSTTLSSYVVMGTENISTYSVVYTSTANVTGSTTAENLGLDVFGSSGFVYTVNALTKTQATDQGYIWVTTKAELTAALANPDAKICLGKNITSIGNITISNFTGELNGNGYTLQGLTSCLFENTSGATIKNLKISSSSHIGYSGASVGIVSNQDSGSTFKNIYITTTTISIEGTAGLLVGDADNSTIDGINAGGTILDYNGISYAGGIVGSMNNVRLTNSISNANITLQVGATDATIGGIAGYVSGNSTINNVNYSNATIFNCKTESPYSCVAGGIAGEVSTANGTTTITNANFNSSAVYTTANGNSNAILGIAGNSSAYNSSKGNSNSLATNSIKNYEFKIYDRNGSLITTMDVTKTTSLNSIMNLLNENGFNAGLVGNVLSVASVNGNYVEGNIAEQLCIANGGTGTALNAVSGKLKTSTKFKDIDSSCPNSLSVVVNSNGVEHTISITSDNTVDDLLTALAGYDIAGYVYSSNGKISLTPMGDSYISSMHASLCAMLNLDASGFSENVYGKSQTSTSTITSHQQANITGSTRFSELGISSNQTIFYKHRQNSGGSFTVSTSETIDDFFTKLSSIGITGSIVDGQVHLTPNGDYGLQLQSSQLAEAIGLTYDTPTTSPGFSDETRTLSASTSMQDLISSSQNIVLTDNGVQRTIDALSCETIGDLLTALAGYGISGYVNNGRITINPTTDSYITSMDSTLRNKLNLSNTWYSTTTGTVSSMTSDAFSATQLNTMTTATKLADIGIEGSQSITVNHEGTLATITFNTTTNPWYSVDDLITTLAGYGIAGSVQDGRLTLAGTRDGYIVAMNNDLKAAFGISNSAVFNTTQTSWTGNPDEFVSDTLWYNKSLHPTTMTGSSSLADLYKAAGYSGVGNYIINIGGPSADNVTINQDATVGDVISTLAQYGIASNIQDGIFSIDGGGLNYVSGMSSDLCAALYMNAGQGISYTTATSSYTVNTSGGTQHSKPGTITADMTTRFDQFTVSIPGVGWTNITTPAVAISANGTDYTISLGASDTLGDMAQRLAAYNIDMSMNNGRVYFTGHDGSYITGFSEELVELFNNPDLTGSCTIQTVTVGFNTRSVAPVTFDRVLNTNTKLSDAGPYLITVNNSGTDYVVTVSSDTSLNDLFTTLGGLGISCSINDGYVTFQNTADSYIKGMDPSFAEALKISTGEGNTYNTATVTTSGNTTSSTLEHSTTTALSMFSTFEKLGMATEGTISVVQNGTDYTITIGTNQTVNDMITQLAGFGIGGYISNGSITLAGTENGYIKYMSDNLKLALGGVQIGEDNSFDTVTNTVYQNPTSASKTRTVTENMTTSTTFSELDSEVSWNSEYISVVSNGTEYTISLSDDKTIDDILTTLAGLGISGQVINGQLALTGTNDAYISGMSDSLRTKLKLSVGSGNTYTAEEITTSGNTVSDHKQRTVTTNMTTSTTLGQMGLSEAGVITVNYQGSSRVIAVTADKTVDDILTTLAGVGIQGSVANGMITLTGGQDAYITGMSDSVRNAMKIAIGENNTYNLHNSYENTVSAEQHRDITYDINPDSVLSRLGLESNATVTVVSSGTEHIVTVTPDMTIDEMLTTLAGYGISGSVQNGRITLAADTNHYIKDMTQALKDAIKVQAGLGNSWTTMDSPTWVNTDSDELTMVKNDLKLTGDTLLSSIGGWNNGDGKLAIHRTDGHWTTITVDQTNTLDQFFNRISDYGLIGSVDSDGKVTITGVGNVYLQNVSGGSNILTALKLSDVDSNIRTVSSNNTSDTLQHTVTVAATGTTQLQDIINESGTHITFDGSNNVSIVLQTTSDAGNSNVTLTFNKTDSIYDVIDTLAEHSISATVDALGNFSVNSSTLTDFDISGTLGTFLMGNYSKEFGTDTTYNVTTNLVKETVFNMDDSTALSNFGVTDGNILITQEGVQYTVNIDTTEIQTVGDFRTLLSQYGFTTQIDDNGRLVVTGTGESTIGSIGGGSNIAHVFGIDSGWDLGEITQTSDTLGDTEVLTAKTTMDRKLSELTDDSGENLGITNGSIYVYQDGTRSGFEINTNETLATLAARLSQYGITAGLSTEGRLYFDGNNDSYLTTDGIYAGNASNILSVFGVEGGWSTRYNSTSDNLEYTETSNQTSLRSTKLRDLQDSSGNNLGIESGTYYIYEDGVRNTETITDDMTVDDLMAQMASYGLIADIAQDGSISVSGHKNSYMATSSLMGANSNIVEALFNSEWDFTNVYTSNGLTAPEDVVQAITRDTHLSVLTKETESGTMTYEEGNITVIRNGVQSNIYLTANDTVGTLMDELALYGFESVINDNGQLILKNTGDSKLQEYSGEGTASNALRILGIGISDWVNTNTYDSGTLTTSTTSVVAATRDTALSDLEIWDPGDKITGEYYIYNNGVKFTAMVSSDETVGSLIETLKSFGLEASLVENAEGTGSTIKVIGNGNSYIAESASVNKSDVVSKLFTGDIIQTNAYTGQEDTKHNETVTITATETTMVSELKSGETGYDEQIDGNIAITVNGVESNINIVENETLGSVLGKFRAIGLEATISNGRILIQSGYNTVSIDAEHSSSSLAKVDDSSLNSRLVYNSDLGGYMASDSTVISTTTQTDNASVSNFANDSTKLGLLNISSGTLTLYRNGQRATIQVDSEETFAQFRSRVASAFGEGDISIKFDKTVNYVDGTSADVVDGYLRFYSNTDNVTIDVGATTDTSNFSAITGVAKNSDGEVISARALYCVNNDSKLTTEGLFKRGTVTEGTFTIGTQQLSIDSNTTMADIVSMINNNSDTNATAYWDNIKGELVIKSRSTGAAFINIEAGTSNFTDIMGYTTDSARMNIETQKVGDNARFIINGTTFTSSSNIISSDVSRIKGVTLNLKNMSKGETVELKIERDKETLANAVSDIVDAYNELMKNVDEQIAADGKLKKETTLKLVRNQLKSLMTSAFGSGTTYRNLDSVGIGVSQAAGGNISTSNADIVNLTFDKEKFLKAYGSDQDALKALLVGADGTGGIFNSVENLIESTLQSTTGYFATAEKSYADKINKLTQKITKGNKEVERYRARLENKFKSMDMLIAQINQQYSTFLQS